MICVIKLIETNDGGYNKQLVYLRSYHGKRLDALAAEVRMTYARFPGVKKVVFDYRGLGDAFPQFLSQPWTDPESGKEYPPWVLDDEKTVIHNAKPLLRAVLGNTQVNQQLVSCLRVALEQRSIEIPISSRSIVGGKLPQDDEDEDSGNKVRTLTAQEKAIFLEADALQIEMGNVVMKVSASGNYLYDTAKSSQRKDRYSALAMAIRYIAELEDARKKKLRLFDSSLVIGVVSSM